MWKQRFLPGWGNSRSQLLADRKPASAAREDLPASHRRCDSFSHHWPEMKTKHTRSPQHFNSIHRSMCNILCLCVRLIHLEHNTGLFQQILRGYGTTDHTTGKRQKKKTTVGLQEDYRRIFTGCVYLCVLISYSLLQKDLYIFPKATWIIVPHSFGISKRFQQRSCLKYLPGIQTHSNSTTRKAKKNV